MAMKRTRSEDALSTINPLKKRRIDNSNSSINTNSNNNKSKIKLTIKKSHNKNESSALTNNNNNTKKDASEIRKQLLSISDLNDPSSSTFNKHQKKIININVMLLNNARNNDNTQFIELMRYYFDDNIFKILNNVSNIDIMNKFIINIYRIIRINNTNNNNLFILMLKFIIISLKFFIEFINKKQITDKKDFLKHFTPSDNLYNFNNNNARNNYYNNLLIKENIKMDHISILYENYKRYCVNILNNNKLLMYGQSIKDKEKRYKKQIELIDKYILGVKNKTNEKFLLCSKRLCENNDKKLFEITSELKKTELFINNKYECKTTIVKNEYNELIDRAKKRLIAKYNEKKNKQERLFKIEFNKSIKKIEKLHEKNNKKEEEIKEEEEEKETPKSIKDIIFKKDLYIRPTLINKNNKHASDWPHFNNEIMQLKWNKISGIDDNEMESDVNTMVADQDKGGLEIKDILSMFPKCDVTYKSDKNQLILKNTNNNQTILKVQSYIACRYKGQCVMLGQVKSISSKDLWSYLRQKGDKFAKYSLINIKIQDIEEGNVKIKLLH